MRRCFSECPGATLDCNGAGSYCVRPPAVCPWSSFAGDARAAIGTRPSARSLPLEGFLSSQIVRACLASSVLFACGASQSCPDILREYDQERSNALICDANSTNACSDQAPVVIKGAGPDGGLALEAIASNCNHAVNPARSARLHDLLTRFRASGCAEQPIPICQQILNDCIQGAAGPTCAP
jgi:hypothetical protein